MKTLYEMFKYNGVPYAELPDGREKAIIDTMAKKLIKDGYESQLLEFRDAAGFGATFWFLYKAGEGEFYDTNLHINTGLKDTVFGAYVYALQNA